MDDMKLRLTEAVAARLSPASASPAKDEVIEELSDNLYRRFLEMTGAGVPEEEAFNRALEDLGDVNELLSYLGVEPPADVTIDHKDGQTRITTTDGQRIIINGGDENTVITTNDGESITINADGSHPITINNNEPEEMRAERLAAEAERIRMEAERARAQAEAAGAPEGRTDEHGDVHYDYGYASSQGDQSDLDAILANVGEICRVAMDQVKEAAKQAKDAIQRRTTVEKDSGHMKVHFNTNPEDVTPPAPPAPPTPPTPPTPPEARGWEFEAELDTDQGRFFAGGGPKEKKDVVYGFGYDKDRGGFYAQWGEYQGDSHAGHTGPHFTGTDSGMHPNDDGSYSVTALKDLRGLEIITTAGDVTIHVSEAPDAGVIIDGDVDELNVTCSADGVLTIREGRTASSSFFSRRGFCSADVELYIPRRHWDIISVNTASGDVDIDRDGLDIDQFTVHTASGNLSARLRTCTHLNFKSASGDLDIHGDCLRLQAETMSGDITLRGQVQDALLHTASGDIELEGPVERLRANAISGDVNVTTSTLPQILELSTKSGDCDARLPDAGPFMLRMKTTTGEFDCAFPMNYINGVFVYGDSSGPVYSMTTISGDVSLERY